MTTKRAPAKLSKAPKSPMDPIGLLLHGADGDGMAFDSGIPVPPNR
jgi:hypothetical protein